MKHIFDSDFFKRGRREFCRPSARNWRHLFSPWPWSYILSSTMVRRMKYGSKLMFAAGVAGFVAVACAIGVAVPSPDNRNVANRLQQEILAYRGGMLGPIDERKVSPRLFAQAYQRVRHNYVYELTGDELLNAATQGMRALEPDPQAATNSDLIEAAITAMLTSLDDYSIYMDPEEYAALNERIRGRFGGLGIEIKKDPLGLEVISPIDGTPAKRAGIVTGDRLTHADGSPLADLSLRDSVTLLRGEPGSTVVITIQRNEDVFDVPLTREVIRIQRVRSQLDDGIGYLRLTQFVPQTGDVLRQHMADLINEASPAGLKGFVLDLRNNPGGLLSESIDVSGAFLSGGLVVSTKSRTDSESFSADLSDPSRGLPVVVLINEGSASASEIVAGAIKYRDRGLVVGQRSFGKGSVQTTFEFASGGGLKLTTSVYYTPSGKSVDGGIEPSIEAVDDPATEDVDEALDLAYSVLRDLAAGRTDLMTYGAMTQ